MVLGFVGIYRSGIRSRGPTRGPQAQTARPLRGVPCELVAPSSAFWTPRDASRVPSGPEKITVKFHRVWTSFDMVFL